MSILNKIQSYLSNQPEQLCPIHEYAFIEPQKLTFSAAVREACESNMCGRYGKCWTCPPGAGDWQKLRDHYMEYSHAFVYTTCHELEDSFDFEGMTSASKAHSELDDAFFDYLSENIDEPHELAGAGSCSLCGDACTYPDAPCRHPDRARRSMEACGMEVTTLAKDCGIHYMNGENTVTYFSILFW